MWGHQWTREAGGREWLRTTGRRGEPLRKNIRYVARGARSDLAGNAVSTTTVTEGGGVDTDF
jgi:hypothetical protein